MLCLLEKRPKHFALLNVAFPLCCAVQDWTNRKFQRRPVSRWSRDLVHFSEEGVCSSEKGARIALDQEETDRNLKTSLSWWLSQRHTTKSNRQSTRALSTTLRRPYPDLQRDPPLQEQSRTRSDMETWTRQQTRPVPVLALPSTTDTSEQELCCETERSQVCGQ